jgi:hypothetical protein
VREGPDQLNNDVFLSRFAFKMNLNKPSSHGRHKGMKTANFSLVLAFSRIFTAGLCIGHRLLKSRFAVDAFV